MSAIVPTTRSGEVLGVVLLSAEDDGREVDVVPIGTVCPCPVRPGHVVAGHVPTGLATMRCACGMGPAHFTSQHEAQWDRHWKGSRGC